MAVSANRLELLQIADAVAREKSIDRAIVITAMEDAIAKAARSRYGAETDVHAGIDAAFIHAGREAPEETADAAHRAHEPIPNEPVHPVRDARGRFAESDHGVRGKFVEPHFVFEEAKQSGLR